MAQRAGGTLRKGGTTGLNFLKCRIQPFQLHTGVGCREVPAGLGVVGVAERARGVDLGREFGGVGDAAVEALAGENVQLGRGKIGSAAMLRRGDGT